MRNRKDPDNIIIDEDGGWQTIEYWCYEEAEKECDELRDKLKLAEYNLNNLRVELKAFKSKEN